MRAAFVFMTRLPVGGFPYSSDDFRWASAHFPLVGLVVGAIGSVALYASTSLGPHLSALLGLYATLYATGAFHEDGLADTADALGGAHSKKSILEILKDSRIGTYGGAALIFTILARFLALATLSKSSLHAFGVHLSHAVVLLPLVHCLARLGPVVLMRVLPYSSEEGAKGSSVAKGGQTPQLLVALFWSLGASTLGYCAGLPPRLLGLFWAAMTLLTLHLVRRFRNATGGFTGDFLGAAEQVNEIAMLLLAIAHLGADGAKL